MPKFEGKNVMQKIQKKVNLWKFQGVMVESIENPGGGNSKKIDILNMGVQFVSEKKKLFNETY